MTWRVRIAGCGVVVGGRIVAGNWTWICEEVVVGFGLRCFR
jgi:hypothetical protein